MDAVRRHLINYDRKYGYRGPEGFVELGDAASRPKAIKTALAKTASSPFMVPAVVTEASPKMLKAAISADEIVTLDAASLKFGRRHLAAKPKKGIDPLRPGSIIRVGVRDEAHPYSIHNNKFDFNDEVLAMAATLFAGVALERLEALA